MHWLTIAGGATTVAVIEVASLVASARDGAPAAHGIPCSRAPTRAAGSSGCARHPDYISPHGTQQRQAFEQQRSGASRRGLAAPTCANSEAERAARIEGACSQGQDTNLVSPLGDGVSGRDGLVEMPCRG